MDKIADEILGPIFGQEVGLPDFFQFKIFLQESFSEKVKVTVYQSQPELVCNTTIDKEGYCHYEKVILDYPRTLTPHTSARLDISLNVFSIQFADHFGNKRWGQHFIFIENLMYGQTNAL